jgi:hypothetical protein
MNASINITFSWRRELIVIMGTSAISAALELG